MIHLPKKWRACFFLIALFLSTQSYGDEGLSFKLDSSKRYKITDYGAVGDGVALETKALQAAIDACHSNGGGIVWVPAGKYQIGTVKLKSHVTLSLDHGASLLGSPDLKDYPVEDLRPAREGWPHCLLYAEDAENIRLEGLGTIDGRGSWETFPRGNIKKKRNIRPRLIRMENCNNLTFSGLTYKNPAFWGIHLIDCKQVHFSGITVKFRNNNFNNDGLDIDGCENVLIENCNISAGDDAICLKSSLNPCRNIIVRNCNVDSNTAAVKFGTSSRGGFINVDINNCYFFNCPMGAIKLQCVDGGTLENVKISRVVMNDVGCPLFIRLGNRGRSFSKHHPNKKSENNGVGTLKNIHVSDVVAKVTYPDRIKATEATYKKLREPDLSAPLTKNERAKAGPIMISGIPGHFVENVLIENVKISFPGLGLEEDSQREVPEDIKRYPEQFFFGVLPAWGAYIRHAKNIEFKNVVLETRENDARKRLILDNVTDFKES